MSNPTMILFFCSQLLDSPIRPTETKQLNWKWNRAPQKATKTAFKIWHAQVPCISLTRTILATTATIHRWRGISHRTKRTLGWMFMNLFSSGILMSGRILAPFTLSSDSTTKMSSRTCFTFVISMVGFLVIGIVVIMYWLYRWPPLLVTSNQLCDHLFWESL